VALLKQIKGVGTLIALTFLLTLEDPHSREYVDRGISGSRERRPQLDRAARGLP
jgi:hypothetical protein